MIIIACVDDNMGMMFNRRRQSKDAIVRKNMLSLLPEGKKLYVCPYTAGQFLPEEQKLLYIKEEFLEEAKDGDYCFIENQDISAMAENVEELVLYRWNRAYPSDRKFTFDLSGYELVGSEEFAGSSHPEMVREIYRRKF